MEFYAQVKTNITILMLSKKQVSKECLKFEACLQSSKPSKWKQHSLVIKVCDKVIKEEQESDKMESEGNRVLGSDRSTQLLIFQL